MLQNRGYNGGKGGEGVFQRIICQMPPHDRYIAPFLGRDAVLRNKRPAAASIGLDLDPDVIAWWRDNTIPGLEARCADAFEFLASATWAGRDLVYLDPPYLMETRSSQRPIYKHELSDAQHRELLAIIQRIAAPVILSGYWSELYARELRGWRTINFPTVKRSGERATEWLWMNFPAPVELHDYRFLGENFTDRQRIKRKIARWEQKLAAMPLMERQALLAAISH